MKPAATRGDSDLSIDRRPQSWVLALGLVALAIAAHWSALLIIDIRAYSVYQHYRPWPALLARPSFAEAVLILQAAVVAILCWRVRDVLVGLGGQVLGRWRILLVCALAGFALAVPSDSVRRALEEVILSGAVALLAGLNLLLAALVLPARVLSRLTVWADSRVTLSPNSNHVRHWDGKLPWAVALWVVVVAATTSTLVFERIPHIDDSISNYFQAKYLAAGHMSLPAPPDTRSFQLDQTVVDAGKWYGYAFPAWPMVLAIGVRIGLPWLVNPLLAGLLILISHQFIRQRLDRGTANAAILLLAFSPWLVFMSAEFMSHPLTAVLIMTAALAIDRASPMGLQWARWAVVGGLAMGALMLTRALDGVIAAGALVAMSVADRRLPRAWPAGVLAGGLAVVVAALIFPYNQTVTGKATYPAHMAWTDSRWGPGVDRLGFGAGVGIRAWANLDPLPGHGPADIVLNANKNVFMTNVDLFGWSTGSLLFVWLAIALGRWQAGDSIMLIVPAACIIGYSCYWFSGGPDLGARYWYPMLVALAVLSIRGAQMFTAASRADGAWADLGPRLGIFIACATLSAAVAMVPWRIATKYYRYRAVGAEIQELAAAHHFDHALVFVKSLEDRREYHAAANYNPWTLDHPGTVYALDAGPSNRAAVVAHFPDRAVWVIERVPVSETVGLLRVIAGPLPPGTVP